MPVTQIDPTPAVIIVDFQRGLVTMPSIHPMSGVVGAGTRLVKEFRSRQLPVALVAVTGGPTGRTPAGPPPTRAEGWTALVDELDRQPGDLFVEKTTRSAFVGTSLDEQLRAAGVTQVFICGITTTGGVETTVRTAFDLGYNVVVVSDGVTDLDQNDHDHCMNRVFPRWAEVATTDEIIAGLDDVPA